MLGTLLLADNIPRTLFLTRFTLLRAETHTSSSAGNSTENCNLVLNFLPTWRSEMHVCRNSRILRRQPLWSNFATACVSGEFNTTTASSDHPPNSFFISFITQSNAMSFSPFPQLNKRFSRISAEFQWTISTVHDSAFCNQWGNSSASDLVFVCHRRCDTIQGITKSIQIVHRSVGLCIGMNTHQSLSSHMGRRYHGGRHRRPMHCDKRIKADAEQTATDQQLAKHGCPGWCWDVCCFQEWSWIGKTTIQPECFVNDTTFKQMTGQIVQDNAVQCWGNQPQPLTWLVWPDIY